jgi:DNA-binding NarL/FixJ family response regulator
MNVPPRILIVEDQYFVAVDCELHLRAAGMECVGLANTAAGALDLAEREKPDLIIMDIRLASRADGVEAAIVIYERLGIRCIFTSAHADEITRKDAARARPIGWVDKPYASEKLISAIQQGLDELNSEPSQTTRGESSASARTLH